MTLYEIDKAITDLADPETGEITDFEALDNLQMARDQKIENIACYYKNLVSRCGSHQSGEGGPGGAAESGREQGGAAQGVSLTRYTGRSSPRRNAR